VSAASELRRATVGEQDGSTERAVVPGPGLVLPSLAFEAVEAAVRPRASASPAAATRRADVNQVAWIQSAPLTGSSRKAIAAFRPEVELRRRPPPSVSPAGRKIPACAQPEAWSRPLGSPARPGSNGGVTAHCGQARLGEPASR
jgi:hypothetical protein